MSAPADGRRVLLMVQELHVRGYQRLRIYPALSPSGMHWRCSVNSSGQASSEGAHYSSAQGRACFGWNDARDATAGRLAEIFLERYPQIAAGGEGADWEYAGWFVWMLHLTYPDALPIAAADRPLRDDCWETVGGGRALAVPLPPRPQGRGRV